MTQTELPALKPCPFCGAAPELEDHRTIWRVGCQCGAGVLGERAPEPDGSEPDSYWAGIRQTAIEAWNRRALMAREAVEVPQWVSVQERLPKAYHSVLVVNEYGVPILACWSGERWFNDDVTDPLHYVTHWMPIPASPTKGQL